MAGYAVIVTGDGQAQALETTIFIRQLLIEGRIRQYGIRLLTTHLSHKYGHRARGDDVRNALWLLDQNGITSRRPGFRRKRKDKYTVPGPDWLWCLDGHDKLAAYGIEIYGCVDAYSRKIIWWYIGSSSRTAVSVVRQYLATVKAYGKCPNYLRTDEGREIYMMADAHYYLYWMALVKAYEEGIYTDEDLNRCCLRDCFITGKSTANVRIEGLWGQQIRGCTESWMIFFSMLKNTFWFREDCPTDKVVLTFIFIPIIKAEVFDWVETHNANPIRSQSKWRYHTVKGVPNDLHLRPEDGAQIRGFPLDLEMHESLESRVRSYDHDEYLTPETLQWCEALLASMKLPSPPLATEFVPFLGEYTIPDWYKFFVLTARQHHDDGILPQLAVSPHPHGAWGWATRQEVDEELYEGRDEYVNLEDLAVRRIKRSTVYLLI